MVSANRYDCFEHQGVKICKCLDCECCSTYWTQIHVTGGAKLSPIGVTCNEKTDSSQAVDLDIGRLKDPKNSAGIEGLLDSRNQIIN